ncbi:hypothetical protein H0S56_04350 [Acinetobacter lwoffii]|uniref:hypothetical protein n=1 Tax=Acinetobacter lwoffii TaxID=28090 RepID=UPI00189D94F3|nr:hypothetical protein [Acinetobacter lwoffii]QPF32887.1 hypothetical protein H0S56_04350 [Acinetobacter lwoffii]
MEQILSQLLKHIDAIAREKNRDVLFVHFDHYVHPDRDANSVRQILIGWLEQQGIVYMPCLGVDQTVHSEIYLGGLYLDVPFDLQHKAYQKLSEYLEDDQGNMKIDGILFFVLSLALALELESDSKVPQWGGLRC